MPKTDVIIIGSGPAGLHAAIQLQRRFGLAAIVLERDPEPGGVPQWCNHHTYPCRVKKRLFTGPEYAKAWLAEARSASVPILTETTVLRLDTRTPSVGATSPNGLRNYQARAILLATGARESHRHARLIPGDRARGVYTTASLFQMLYGGGVLPGRRFVIYGSEDVSYSCVNAIKSHGGTVVAVVEPSPATRSFRSVQWYFEKLRGVDHFFSVRDFAIHGRDQVNDVSFTIANSGTLHRLEIDAVVFTGGFTPNSELVRAAEVRFNPATRGPGINQLFQSSKPWLFAAGNCLRGVVSGDEAALEGRMAARAIAEYLQRPPADNLRETSLVVEPPLAYCCPDRLLAAAQGMPRVAIWSNVHATKVDLVAWQGKERIWSKRFRSVQPGRRLFVPVTQLTAAPASEFLRFSLES
jgi:thioredoxin reductase